MPSKILTINALLREAGLDLGQTKLVRHSSGRHRIDMFGAWLHRRRDFEQYQSIQSKPRGSYRLPGWPRADADRNVGPREQLRGFPQLLNGAHDLHTSAEPRLAARRRQVL